jgi:hypothetical protein
MTLVKQVISAYMKISKGFSQQSHPQKRSPESSSSHYSPNESRTSLGTEAFSSDDKYEGFASLCEFFQKRTP